MIETGCGDDVVIISCQEGPPGPQGPPGPPGKDGTCLCNAKTVTTSYVMDPSDQYLGITSVIPTTITLPLVKECTRVVIKAEMGPPLGNRKITIVAPGGATIDGNANYIIEVPYGSVALQYNNGNWYII